MIVLCSGGFDPLHVGHLSYLKDAAHFGDVVVALNSDAWLMVKKGFVFQPWNDRMLIVKALSFVASVSTVEDSDGTVCEALRRIRPHYFANGGDRTKANPLEDSVCNELGIIQLLNTGGAKIRSSSELVRGIVKS